MRRPALTLFAAALAATPLPAASQTKPSADDIAAYAGLHAAAATGNLPAIEQALTDATALQGRDARQRTPLHVAVHLGHREAVTRLLRAGADPNALDFQSYDALTIAAVADDLPMVQALLAGGARADNITSPYQGTALIAAAHLGHDGVVRALIAAGAPLDHVNNLGWTALIEAIVLGHGEQRHIRTLKALVEAGADVHRPDRAGMTPLALARARGYGEMVQILQNAGAR